MTNHPRRYVHHVDAIPYVDCDTRQPTAGDGLNDVIDTGRLMQDAIRHATERAILRLRLEGGSWTDVGRIFGVTRQAARKRWGYVWEQCRGVELRREVVDGQVVPGSGFYWSADLGERIREGDLCRLDAAEELRSIATMRR